METAMENIDNLQMLSNRQLQDCIKELGGKPFKYKNKRDNIKYIKELMENAIAITNTIINYQEKSKIKNIQHFVKSVDEQEQQRKINHLEEALNNLSNENRLLRSNVYNLNSHYVELQRHCNYALEENITLKQRKSLCVTNELTELTELILDKSASNEIPEGTALELNNKLLEIYKKSKHGSVATYHEQEQIGVVEVDEAIIYQGHL